MSTPRNRAGQPAALRRRIEKLEALLAAEQQRADLAFASYREVLYDLVEARQRLDAVREALK